VAVRELSPKGWLQRGRLALCIMPGRNGTKMHTPERLLFMEPKHLKKAQK
jgi:hypothetical protein